MADRSIQPGGGASSGAARNREAWGGVWTDVNRPLGSEESAGVRLSAPSPGDGELARRAARGDRNAAGELIERYQASVRSFLCRLCGDAALADDLAQETFIRMLRYAHRYDPQYAMRTWLLTIARRLWINQGARGRRAVTTDNFDTVHCTRPKPDEQVSKHDQGLADRARLDAALAQLTEAQRQAIVLFHQQELGVNEVADVMGVPVGTVKSHLHRGRAAMRKLLSDEPSTLDEGRRP